MSAKANNLESEQAGNSEPAERKTPAADGRLRLLVLGGDVAELPALDEIVYVTDTEVGFDAVAVLEPFAPARLGTLLARTDNPLAPVAAFGLFEEMRADFTAPVASPVTLRQALAALDPVRRQLADIPAIANHPDEEGLFALGLAHSRRQSFEASWNPHRQDAVWYPLFGPVPGPRRRLEMLADLGLLRRRFFKRLSTCGQCDSARLNVYESCVSCGGAQLGEEELVHHYPCGHKAAEAEFLDERDLICPKCRGELRHLGVDYDRPGVVLTCADCKTVMAEPFVAFDCMDCGHTNPGDGTQTVDWFHYDLTTDGVEALVSGELPHLDFTALLSPLPRTYPLRDFMLLAREGIRVARRYERPFSIMSVAVTNRGALEREFGVARTAASFRAMVNIFVEVVREADFMTASRGQTVVMALPETTEDKTGVIVGRLKESLRETIELPIELEMRAATGEAAAGMLESLK